MNRSVGSAVGLVVVGLWFATASGASAQDPAAQVPGLQPTRTLKGNEKPVHGVAFSPDGKWVASAGEDVAILWDAETGKPARRLEPEGGSPMSFKVAFAPDGKTLAVSGYSGDVYFWDPETGKLLGKFDEPSLASDSLEYSPDGALLAVMHDQKDIMLYDVKAAKLLDTIASGEERFRAFAFSGDGKALVAITEHNLMFYDAASRKRRKAIDLGAREDLAHFEAVACSPAAPMVAACGGPLLKQKTAFFDLKTYQMKGALASDPYEPSVRCLAFSRDGKRLATGASAGELDRTPVSLWDVATGRRIGALTGPTNGVTQVAFSADGKRVAASSFDQAVRIWDLSKSGTGKAAKSKAGKRAKAGKRGGSGR